MASLATIESMHGFFGAFDDGLEQIIQLRIRQELHAFHAGLRPEGRLIRRGETQEDISRTVVANRPRAGKPHGHAARQALQLVGKKRSVGGHNGDDRTGRLASDLTARHGSADGTPSMVSSGRMPKFD